MASKRTIADTLRGGGKTKLQISWKKNNSRIGGSRKKLGVNFEGTKQAETLSRY